MNCVLITACVYCCDSLESSQLAIETNCDKSKQACASCAGLYVGRWYGNRAFQDPVWEQDTLFVWLGVVSNGAEAGCGVHTLHVGSTFAS